MSGGRIFISYTRKDKEAATRFYNGLKSAGLNPWIDIECLRPGENWKNAIKQAIRDSQYFLALISTNSVDKRGYVQKEINEALEVLSEFPDNKIFFIPVRLDECEPSQGRLNDLHRVDMFPNWDNGFAKILSVLKPNGEKRGGAQFIHETPEFDTQNTDNAPYSNDIFMQPDLEILRAINAVSSSSYIPPLPICSDLNLDPLEFADRLELQSKLGYVDVIMGSFVPGLSLPNGIYNIRLTALGRQILRKTTPKSTDEKSQFTNIVNLMPDLISEMKKDISGNKLVRDLAFKSKRSTLNCSRAHFEYYEEEHPDLYNKAVILENHGYIFKIPNTDMHRMTENFVRILSDD